MHKTLTGLIPDTQYGVQVRAINGPNVSEWSPRFDFETAHDGGGPPPVTNVTITVVSDTFHIEWDRMGNNPNNGNSPITRYEMELFGNSYLHDGNPSFLQGSTPRLAWNMLFGDNLNLFLGIPRATVKVRIRAVDANGLLGEWSDQVQATNPPPGPVVNLTGVGITDGIYLEWQPPPDDDLIGYRIYAETSSNTFIPVLGLNDQSFTPALSYFFETIISGTWHFVVVAVDKFNSESIVWVRVSATSSSSFDFDVIPPPPPENVAATITTDPVTLNTIMHVTWDYEAEPDGPPDDLASFQIRYRIHGTTAWAIETIPVNADEIVYEAFIEQLEPYVQYDVQMLARDFLSNASNWTLNVIAEPAENQPPSEPDDPVAVGNTMRIQVVHNGNNWEGYPLEEDVAFLEVYASTTNAPMTFAANAANIIGTIPFGPGMVQTFNIPATTAGPNTQQWYVSVLAVDRLGLRGPMSTLVPVAVGLIDTINVTDAAITNAKIFDLQVQKLTAGSGIINDLIVKSTLTMGDALNTGYIKSHDWSPLASGWRIGKGTFEVNDGVIRAGALQIQSSDTNYMPPAYADFEWGDRYYISSALNPFGHSGLYVSSGAADTGEPGALYNKKYLRIYSLANSNVITARFTTQALGANGYNINVEEGAQYIVSGYFKNNSASTCIWNLDVVGNVSGTPTTIYTQAITLGPSQTSWTRYQGYFTVPAGCNQLVVGVSNGQNDRVKDLRLDGFQLERVMGNKLTASPWKPPGTTTIDGAGIITGFIRSTGVINVNGTDQPLWSLDLEGNMQVGDAQVRGRLVVGDTLGTETNSYIASSNFSLGLSKGWKIDGTGNAYFAHIDLSATDGSSMALGRFTHPYTGGITSGMIIYPPAGVVTAPTLFATRWYTHADFGQGSETQIIGGKRFDWGGTPPHIYLGAYSGTNTSDIDMFGSHFYLKSQFFKFADNSGNRVEFRHAPTVGGYDDGFAFVGASGKKITFDFNAANNRIISRDSVNNIQRLFMDGEYLMMTAYNVGVGPNELYVGVVGDRLGLHNSNAAASNTVALYYGLDSGGFGSLKATNFGGTVNRKFEAQEFVVTSDKSMKKNAKAVTGALDAVNAIPVLDYDFNMGDGPTATAKKKDLQPNRGVLAQDVQAVVPQAVSEDPDSGTLAVGMYGLMSTVLAAVQELDAKVESMKKAK